MAAQQQPAPLAPHHHHQHHHSAFLCDGSPWSAQGGGSFVGHVLPGIVLAAWALHAFVSASFGALTGRAQQRRGAAHHGVSGLPAPLKELAEPVCKVVFPAVAILLELKLSGTRALRCPPGSAKAGELDVQHMNSWSHSSLYPPLMLSGVADLLHTAWAPLPPGVPHFFLGSAFSTHALLMLAHAKADPLDALLHRLLGWCQAAAAGVTLLQAARASKDDGGSSFGLDAARSLALLMQACWFWVITHVMFTDDPMWRSRFDGDHTRLMFTHVLCAWVFLGVLAFLSTLYVCMHTVLSRRGLLQQQQQQPDSAGLGGGDHSMMTGSGKALVGSSAGRRSRAAYVRLQRRQGAALPDSEGDAACSSADDTAIEMV